MTGEQGPALAVRKAFIEDLPRILELYAMARVRMKESGNPHQWGDSYPPRELVERDIKAGVTYVICTTQTAAATAAVTDSAIAGDAAITGSTVAEDATITGSTVAGSTVAEGATICGVFMFTTASDPTYAVIRDGSWLNDKPYGTIHRVAGDGMHKGILRTAVTFCVEELLQKASPDKDPRDADVVGELCQDRADSKLLSINLKMDTHEDNKIMQHALEKNGFVRCGIIITDDGTERIAYQKEKIWN